MSLNSAKQDKLEIIISCEMIRTKIFRLHFLKIKWQKNILKGYIQKNCWSRDRILIETYSILAALSSYRICFCLLTHQQYTFTGYNDLQYTLYPLRSGINASSVLVVLGFKLWKFTFVQAGNFAGKITLFMILILYCIKLRICCAHVNCNFKIWRCCRYKRLP